MALRGHHREQIGLDPGDMLDRFHFAQDVTGQDVRAPDHVDVAHGPARAELQGRIARLIREFEPQGDHRTRTDVENQRPS